MQKRGFGKRQAAPNPDLDFTQKPKPDFDAPISRSGDPFSMPQSMYYSPMPPQNTASFQAYAPQNTGFGNMPYPVEPSGVQGSYTLNVPGYSVPYTGAPLPPLANAAQGQSPLPVNGRAQGYVPPSVMQAEPVIPTMQQAVPQQSMGYPPYGQPLYAMQQPAGQPGGATNGFPAYGGGGGGMPPEQPPIKRPKQPFQIDNWLKMLLYIILPLIFVVCIALRDEGFDLLRYLFMTASAASVGMLWYRQLFSSSVRTGVTIGYGLMCIVLIVMMLSGASSDMVKSNNNITPQPTPSITEEPSAEALGYSPDQAPQTTEPVELTPAETEAGLRLAAFMDNWGKNDIETMLTYVMLSWRSGKADPANALFNLVANRTPIEYTIEAISGSAGDTSRAITMSATIDKNNGNDPVRYRFNILMSLEDGDWYVDPNTLSTNETTPTETPLPDNIDALYTPAPRTTVTPVPPASTLLYYNASGGKYYHADPNCDSVNSKYLPMASFTYGEVNTAPYSSLIPCLQCNAPTR